MKALLFAAAAVIAPLSDPQEEARARALENEIRCVVCENEPISQSTAEIASDMRRLIRARIEAGESDGEIRAFFRERYGEFVLLRPELGPATWLLWAAPGLLLLAGLGAMLTLRRAKGEAAEPEEGER